MSLGTIAAIAAVIILTIAVPLGTMCFFAKSGGSWKDFLVGAATFIVLPWCWNGFFTFWCCSPGQER